MENKKQYQHQPVELIPTALIQTGTYQREVAPHRAARIAAEFNQAKLGVLVVNRRADGTYTILDGQHRLAAIRILGIPDARCIVMDGLSEAEEADYFRFQNENVRSLTYYDLYNAGVCAGDLHYTTMRDILAKHGYRVRKSGRPNGIAAVEALTKIVQLYGFEALENLLALTRATWPNDVTAVRRELLAGLAEFASRFHSECSPAQFAARMGNKHPSQMLYELQMRTQGRATPNSAFNPLHRFTMCSVLVDEYNKGLSSKSKQRLNLSWDAPTTNV